jgi:hypothetical protein
VCWSGDIQRDRLAFFQAEAIDGAFYAAFALWFAVAAYGLRAGAGDESRLRWMRRSGFSAAVLFGLAALFLPMAIGDRDYACIVACAVLMAPTAARRRSCSSRRARKDQAQEDVVVVRVGVRPRGLPPSFRLSSNLQLLTVITIVPTPPQKPPAVLGLDCPLVRLRQPQRAQRRPTGRSRGKKG